MNLNSMYSKLEKFKNSRDFNIIDEVMKDIETEILTNGKVNKGLMSTWKRFLKDTEHRPVFNQIYKSPNGNYVACNGYFMIDYGIDKNNVPKELQAYIETLKGNYEVPNIDFEHVKLNEAEDIKEYEINVEEVEKLSKWNKLNKKKNYGDRIPYRIENKYINGDYLLDILTLMGLNKNKKIKVRMTDSNIAPLEIVTENIKSMLLPINASDRKEIYDNKLKEILGI